MKKSLYRIYQVLLGIVLIGIISNWFIHYSDQTNRIIKTIMFILIGIGYIVGGFVWDKKITNLIFLICGFYLITMNFISDFKMKSLIGIICILTPMLIARFSPEARKDKELT